DYEEPLNLFQRISAIRAEVTAVAKEANVDNKYRAVTHDDVTRMLRPLMVKHGVVSFLSLASSEMVDTGVDWKNRRCMQLRSIFIVTYVNVEDSCERFEVRVEAHADDAGDKAPGKVASYAQKYADLKTFAVPTGEDDEQRISEDKITVAANPLTEEQLADLWSKADELFGDDALDILAGLAKKIFGLDAYAKIESKHFETAISWLEKKRAKMDKDAAE
ncbi:hypothetical protein LCGC14_2992590, partial [marine sediment metagenome]